MRPDCFNQLANLGDGVVQATPEFGFHSLNFACHRLRIWRTP